MLIIVACFFVIASKSFAEVTDEQYASMPELFLQDNFDNCMLYGDEALYCLLTYEVKPIDVSNTSKIWQIIEEVSANPLNYRHDHLRHGICVPKTCSNVNKSHENDPLLKDAISACYNEKYEHMGLKGVVTKLKCETNEPKYPIDWMDIIVAVMFILYIAFVLFATFYEGVQRYKSKEVYDKFSTCQKGRMICAFSLTRNWIRLKTIKSTPDIDRLRNIQGIRLYNMIIVIMSHTVMTFLLGPVFNTKYQETLSEKPATIFLASGPLAVATFFLISCFLMVYGIFDYFHDKKEIKPRFLFLAFLNRYVRLTPTLLVTIVFHSTWLRHLGTGPNWNNIIGKEYLRCRENWWTNLLYLNILINPERMCLQTTWFLSLDTLYFAAFLFIIYLMKKYEKYVWFILGSLLTANMVATFFENYLNDFPALDFPRAELYYDMKNTLSNPQWRRQLASPIGNFAGPIMGAGFGYYYYKYRGQKLFKNKFRVFLWYIFSLGFGFGVVILPGLVILEKSTEHHIIWASLHVAFSRPIFAFAVAMMILGCSEGVGWLSKYVLEWSPTYILGRLTFSAYLVHMSLVMSRISLSRGPIYIYDYLIITTLFGDIAVTYLFATVLTLFIEMPISELQKLIVPQKKETKEEIDTKKE